MHHVTVAKEMLGNLCSMGSRMQVSFLWWLAGEWAREGQAALQGRRLLHL